MSTAAERGKNRKKSPLEFTLKHGAVKPGVIISQQCFGPLSGLTAPGLQAALLNAAADLLEMLNRHIAIICQQYNSPFALWSSDTYGDVWVSWEMIHSCIRKQSAPNARLHNRVIRWQTYIREKKLPIREPSQPGGRCDCNLLLKWMHGAFSGQDYLCSHRWGCMTESYWAEGSLCDWSYWSQWITAEADELLGCLKISMCLNASLNWFRVLYTI